MRCMDWLNQLLSEDGVSALDMRSIRQLERIWLKKIRHIRLESGQIVAIADVFRRCGWWSD